MPESSLTPQQVEEKVTQSGLSKDQIQDILDVVLKNKDDTAFGKTISILLANPNETTVGGIIRDLTKAKPDSDLGRVLTVLQALNFDVTLAQLYKYVQTGTNADNSQSIGFLQSLENIPILGHLIYIVKLPIVWIAGLFGDSEAAAPTPKPDENPQSMGFVDNCVDCYVTEIYAQAGEVIDLTQHYAINLGQYTAVQVLDTIGGDTGSVRVKKNDGFNYKLTPNNVRHVPIQRFPSLRYVATDKADVLTLQAYNANTHVYASTMIVKIVPTQVQEINVEAGEIVDLTKYYTFNMAEYTHVKFNDKNAGETGSSTVTKESVSGNNVKSSIELTLPANDERYIPIGRYHSLRYHARENTDTITLQAYHDGTKATGPLMVIKISPVLSVDRK